MRRPTAALLAIAVLVGSGCAASPPSIVTQAPPVTAAPLTLDSETTTTSPPDLTALARDAVVRVRNVACLATGTAFFTADDQIVTNRHVVADFGQPRLQLSTWDGTDLTASTASISAVNDLARMTASAGRASKLRLATSDPSAGERIWVAGYPLGDQLQLTAGAVIDEVSASTFGQSGLIIRSTAPIKPGNSGSPVLDDTGLVVGVAFGAEKATGDALIVPAASLQRFLTGQQPLLAQTPTCSSG